MVFRYRQDPQLLLIYEDIYKTKNISYNLRQPLICYLNYCNHYKRELLKQSENYTMTEIETKLEIMWFNLSYVDKKFWAEHQLGINYKSPKSLDEIIS